MFNETEVTSNDAGLANTILTPRANNSDRRKSIRLPCQKNCSVRAFTAKTTYPARILNVSQSGLGLASDERIAVETRMTLRLYEPELQVKMLHAIVRHATALESGGGWLIGCELLQDLPRDDVKCLLAAEEAERN